MQEGRYLLVLTKSRNLVTKVNYHNRFNGTSNKVKRLIDCNANGELYQFVGKSDGPLVPKEKGST
jgi:predicted dehydrogenase